MFGVAFVFPFIKIHYKILFNEFITVRRSYINSVIHRNMPHNSKRSTLMLAPYKIKVVHELRPLNFGRRQWTVVFLNNDDILYNLFSDEASFQLSGY
ncbi:hypothetical protein NQ318_007416 [Aromia moschata]|uniref:Uncharacterized protein n=1 Tax=Aromia moschata TaxID=1265417 RepID=A0AAV8YNL7_9CUCU|nr:hypothetical protein NQ318_007416 [Aromia moschata]